jgi:hypothetical protein
MGSEDESAVDENENGYVWGAKGKEKQPSQAHVKIQEKWC